MRQVLLGILPLVLAVSGSREAHAQAVADRATRLAPRALPPLATDPLAFRAAVIALPSRSLFATMYKADSLPTRSECPMLVMRPDSARRFAAIAGQAPHSADRMPVLPSACTNPLDAPR
jgi:hypothetical protein